MIELAVPNSEDTPWSSSRWWVRKSVQISGAELSDVTSVKSFFFSLLKTDYVAVAFIDFVSDGVPFRLWIDPSNVPTEDFVVSCIVHSEYWWEKRGAMTHLVAMQDYDRDKIEETDKKRLEDKANNWKSVTSQPI